jgi:stress-induced morphogen
MSQAILLQLSLTNTHSGRSMPMSADQLQSELRAAFPDADIGIVDLAGDGDHYRASIVSKTFVGLSRVKQHQLVYQALKGKVGGELHALALETSAPQSSGS